MHPEPLADETEDPTAFPGPESLRQHTAVTLTMQCPACRAPIVVPVTLTPGMDGYGRPEFSADARAVHDDFDRLLREHMADNPGGHVLDTDGELTVGDTVTYTLGTVDRAPLPYPAMVTALHGACNVHDDCRVIDLRYPTVDGGMMTVPRVHEGTGLYQWKVT